MTMTHRLAELADELERLVSLSTAEGAWLINNRPQDKLTVLMISNATAIATTLRGAAQGAGPWVSVDVRLPRSAKDEYVQVYSKAGFQNTLQTSEFRNQLDYARQECMWTHWKPLGPSPDAAPAPAPQGEKERIIPLGGQPVTLPHDKEMHKLAERAVEAQRRDKRTDIEIARDGASFICGPAPGAQAGLTDDSAVPNGWVKRMDMICYCQCRGFLGIRHSDVGLFWKCSQCDFSEPVEFPSQCKAQTLPVESGEAKP